MGRIGKAYSGVGVKIAGVVKALMKYSKSDSGISANRLIWNWIAT